MSGLRGVNSFCMVFFTGLSFPSLHAADPLRFGAEEAHRRAVDQPYRIAGIEHGDALAQVLQDVLVELGQVLQIHATLAREGLAFLDAPGKRAHGERQQRTAEERPEHHHSAQLGNQPYVLAPSAPDRDRHGPERYTRPAHSVHWQIFFSQIVVIGALAGQSSPTVPGIDPHVAKHWRSCVFGLPA